MKAISTTEQPFAPTLWQSGKVMETEWSFFSANKKQGTLERLLCPGAPQVLLTVDTNGPKVYATVFQKFCNEIPKSRILSSLLHRRLEYLLPFSFVKTAKGTIHTSVCMHTQRCIYVHVICEEKCNIKYILKKHFWASCGFCFSFVEI